MTAFRRAIGAAAAGVTLLLILAAAPSKGQTVPGKLVVGYLASWKLWSDARLDAVPANRLTHLVYAFGNVSSEGLAEIDDPCLDVGACEDGQSPAGPGGAFSRLAEIKRDHPRLRLLVSVGGWNGSKYFSRAAESAGSRERFAKSVVRVFFKDRPGLFDGVDLDWEYPIAAGAPGNLRSPHDGRNLTLLMQAMRQALDALSADDGRRYELSVAVPADRGKAAHFQLARLSRIADWIGLMSYDYHAGATHTGFNAPLFAAARTSTPEMNVDASVRMALVAGVSPDRLVLGLPFYGHAYGGVPARNGGLFQPVGTGAPASWGGADGIDYRDLVARHPTRHGFVLRRDPDARVPWLYNPHSGIWISYDDPASIEAKCVYVRSHGLAGVMIWHIGADDGSLLRAALVGLAPPASPRVR